MIFVARFWSAYLKRRVIVRNWLTVMMYDGEFVEKLLNYQKRQKKNERKKLLKEAKAEKEKIVEELAGEFFENVFKDYLENGEPMCCYIMKTGVNKGIPCGSTVNVVEFPPGSGDYYCNRSHLAPVMKAARPPEPTHEVRDEEDSIEDEDYQPEGDSDVEFVKETNNEPEYQERDDYPLETVGPLSQTDRPSRKRPSREFDRLLSKKRRRSKRFKQPATPPTDDAEEEQAEEVIAEVDPMRLWIANDINKVPWIKPRDRTEFVNRAAFALPMLYEGLGREFTWNDDTMKTALAIAEELNIIDPEPTFRIPDSPMTPPATSPVVRSAPSSPERQHLAHRRTNSFSNLMSTAKRALNYR